MRIVPSRTASALLALVLACMLTSEAHADERTTEPESRLAFAGGAAMFGLSYAPALVLGVSWTALDWQFAPAPRPFANATQQQMSYAVNHGSWVLALPAMGPSVFLATRPSDARGPLAPAVLVTDTVVQTAGLAMMLLASLHPERRSERSSLMVVPMRSGVGNATGVQALLVF